jgi:hypothetical protein
VRDGRPLPRKWLAAGLTTIAVLSVIATVTLPGVYRALPLLSPDSATYLEWSPGRTPAYPAFLAVVRLLSPDLRLLGPIQLIVFLAAAAWCSIAFARVYWHPIFAVLLGASVMLHPQLVSYAFAALPESLFAATLCVNLGAVLVASRSARLLPYVFVGLTLALLILLKPSGYGLAAGLLAIALCARPQPLRRVAVVAGVLGGILGVVATTNQIKHGFFATQAQGGFSLLAHVGQLVEPAQAGPLSEVTNLIAADVNPHREALQSINDLNVYYLFASHDYHTIERIVRQRIGADVERRFGSGTADHRQFPSNPILLREITASGAEIGRRAIAEHPREYIRHVLAQLYGLWFLPLFQPADNIARLSASLDEVRAASPALDRSPVAFRRVPMAAFFSIRVLLIGVLAASLAAMALAVLRWTPRYLPLGYAALALHANFALVAAVQPGLPRYALVMWPAAALTLAGIIALLFDLLLRHHEE